LILEVVKVLLKVFRVFFSKVELEKQWGLIDPIINFSFVSHISPMQFKSSQQTHTHCNKNVNLVINNSIAIHKVLKTLHPGEIRTHDL
jgi:hypothetical protein